MDKRKRNMKNMKQDFFTYLPSEIITEILLRVPARAILSCKCVCKTWRDLVSTQEFAQLHLSKSVTVLALTVIVDTMNKIMEITNDLHINTIVKLNFSHTMYPFEWIEGSVDGLLLLNPYKRKRSERELYLCNPITREYIDLYHPHSQPFETSISDSIIYGFGMSKITGLYKVVGIKNPYDRETECKVYTIGTGLWRTVAPHAQVLYTANSRNSGEFLNGSLHWVAYDSNYAPCISCFDLETELFNTFSPPPRIKNAYLTAILSALEGSLCLCATTLDDYTITIWLMKEYGVEKSWTKEFVIQSESGVYFDPIKVSKDEVILRDSSSSSLFLYSSKNKTIHRLWNTIGLACGIPISHTPSLLSLKSFGTENSSHFDILHKQEFS